MQLDFKRSSGVKPALTKLNLVFPFDFRNKLVLVLTFLLLITITWIAGNISTTQQLISHSINENYRTVDFYALDIGDSRPIESTTAPIISLAKFTILAIDAGHGGVDPGSIGKNGLTEKEITLILAKKVRSQLSSVKNLHIALTRYDDSTININSRNEIIKKTQADFVLSLHLNSIPQENITLVESYFNDSQNTVTDRNNLFIRSDNTPGELSRLLAVAVQESVFETVKRHNKVSVNAGLKTTPMRILSQNQAYGALLEVTCLSNPEEEERLGTNEYLDKLATSIANGIKLFLHNSSKNLSTAKYPAKPLLGGLAVHQGVVI